MKKYFQNVDILCRHHKRPRLGHSELCICMKADAGGAAILIRAVDEVTSDLPPAKRTLTLRRSGHPGEFRSIQLIFSPVTDELRIMSLEAAGDVAIWEFTPDGLPDIRSALIAWRDGAEDFCAFPHGKNSELGPKDRDSGEMWFWRTMLP